MSAETTTDDADGPENARGLLIMAAVATGLLYIIPYGEWVIYPLMLFSTYAHEMGHGLTAELMGGDFMNFQMWGDGSGVATHRGHYSAIDRAMVSAGGLIGPSVLAAIFFVVARSRHFGRIAMGVFGAMVFLSVLLVVRNGFGIGFAIALGTICVGAAALLSAGSARFLLMFFAIQLSLTVFSRGDYLFMEYAQTSAGQMPSDVKHIELALGGPYWLWGGLVGLASVAVLVFGVWGFFRATGEQRA